MTTDSVLTARAVPRGQQLQEVLDAIAADYRRRLDEGGHEPPGHRLSLVREHRLGAVRLASELGGGDFTVPGSSNW